MQHLPLVGVVVLNWNGREDTLAALESLSRVNYPNLRVVVVDNGSADGSQEAIRQCFPDVMLIESSRNLGFAGGNNIGIRRVLDDGVDAVLLLNNDVEVAPDFLDHLVTELYFSPDVGAVNPKIYYHSEPNLIWSAGGMINYRDCTTVQRHIDEQDVGQAEKLDEVDFAVGCAVMVKREVIEKAGLLDPQFFIYYEETEWCHRIRRAGYRILYVPQSRIWHKVSRSMASHPNLTLYYFSRNRLLFSKKCDLGPLETARIAVLGLGRIFSGYLVHRKFDHSRVVWKALRDFYAGRYGEGHI